MPAAGRGLSVTWVEGQACPSQRQPTLSMDALRKLSSSRRASAREQELMTTDVSVESSSSWDREAKAPGYQRCPHSRAPARRRRARTLVSSSCTMVAWQSEMLSLM